VPSAGVNLLTVVIQEKIQHYFQPIFQ